MLKSPHGDRKDDSRRLSAVAGATCSGYIAASGEITGNARWAAEQLSQLQLKRKVKVIITWPAVAGDGCYMGPNGRSPLVDRVRSLFEQVDITVIGEPQDSVFQPQHMLDTYYHIDSEAAELRTRRLIDRMKASGFTAASGDAPTTINLAFWAMRELETQRLPISTH
jgi:hypothetical protein